MSHGSKNGDTPRADAQPQRREGASQDSSRGADQQDVLLGGGGEPSEGGRDSGRSSAETRRSEN